MSRVLIIGSHTPVSREIGDELCASGLPMEYSAGHADTLQRLRIRSFGVVITSADSAIDESLALLEEMRSIRPGVKCIVLAHHSTPDEVITAERLLSFAKELSAQLPEDVKQDIIQALREILLNAMEHGAAFNPEQVVEVTAIRTGRAMVFRVRDPGAGFRQESLSHAAVANSSSDPTAHIAQREEEGMRAGGYGLLLASGTVDELIYNEIGNEAILIKYLDATASADTK
jgi:anti-sigma regulatory factor (Ser/Thr protein kinase)